MLTLCPALYSMLRPLPGLERYSNFEIATHQEYEPFLFMVAQEDPTVSLTLIDPFLIRSDYKIRLDKQHLAGFSDLEDEPTLAVYVVVAAGPDGLGANMAAPIVFHQASRQAAQLLLDDPGLSLFERIAQRPC